MNYCNSRKNANLVTMKYFYSFLFYVVFLLASANSAFSQLATFTHYNHTNGLATSTTLVTFQDRNGYLHIGTAGAGVMRYDGNIFSSVPIPREHTPMHVSDITSWKESFYYGTLYSGIFEKRKNKFIQIFRGKNGEGEIISLGVYNDKKIAFTDLDIFILNKKNKVSFKHKLEKGFKLVVSQKIITPSGIVFLTNYGNYFFDGQLKPLHSFIGKENRITFGSYKNKILHLYDLQKKEIVDIVFGLRSNQFKCSRRPLPFSVPMNFKVQRASAKDNVIYIATVDNVIYRVSNGKIKYLIKNTFSRFKYIYSMCTDDRGNLWFNSDNGLYNVSEEIFTKLELLDIYLDPAVYFIYKTQDQYSIISSGKSKTYIGLVNKDISPILYNFGVNAQCEINGITYLATNNGIKTVSNGNVSEFHLPNTDNNEITLIKKVKNLWLYSIKGEGLTVFDEKTRKIITNSKYTGFATYFYRAEVSFNEELVYFGSNGGIIDYSLKTGLFSEHKEFEELGSYTGNSCVDRNGIIWFTLEKGLAGILPNQTKIILNNPKYFPSTIFYSLESDDYGNLIIGTNVGINIIKVDEEGNVLYQKNYGKKEGFNGYETNMRSSFKSNGVVYVGTIEGIYAINTNTLNLRKTPKRPIVFRGQENEQGELIFNNKNFTFTIKQILEQNKGVLFTYRLKGIDKNWSKLTNKNEITIPELDNGGYILEVRSTFDGRNFSEISKLSFTISNPIWKSKWFIALIVIVIALLNVGFISWSKVIKPQNIIESKETAIDVEFIPTIIIASFIAQVAINITLSYLFSNEYVFTWLDVILSGLTLGMYAFSYNALHKSKNVNELLIALVVTYTITSIWLFLKVYLSNLGIYPQVFIVLLSSILPFIFKEFRWVVVVNLLQIIAGFILVFIIEAKSGIELMFIIILIISSVISIFLFYIRNNSMQHLLLINSIVNRGNIITIVYNEEHNIIFNSKNVRKFFSIDGLSLAGKHMSIFNSIIASKEVRDLPIEGFFKEKSTFTIPMFNQSGGLSQIEWTHKEINQNVHMILGIDVTEKVKKTNNYESMIENSEEIIYLSDINGKITFANEKAKVILGFRNENLIGKNFLFFLLPEYKQKVPDFYRNQMEGLIHNSYLEFPVKTKDGTVIWLGQNVSLIFDEGSRKKLVGFQCFARDISEKRATNLLVEQQNKDITNSINSAKQIQLNMLPSHELFNNAFQEHFLIFKPKSIVSGDFYWLKRFSKKSIFILADSSDRGVPGAFMTILGYNLLNQIIIQKGIHEPSEILLHMNIDLRKALGRDRAMQFQSTMSFLIAVFYESSVCIVSNGVSFIHVKNEEETNFYHAKDKNEEDLMELVTNRGTEDHFYFMTDGFSRQIGSLKNKEFSNENVEELVNKIQFNSFAMQKKQFENAWRNWSEGHEQTDDFTIIGLKGPII